MLHRELAICMLLQIVALVDSIQKGNVIRWSITSLGGQTLVPWISESNEIKPVAAPVEIEMPSKLHKIRVECIEFDNESPRAYIYTLDGIRMDTAVLRNIKDVCTKTKNYISLKDNDPSKGSMGGQVFIVIYLMAGVGPKCVERKYIVNAYPTMGVVDRKDFPNVECPAELKTAAQQGMAAGGVVSLGGIGKIHLMDYNAKLLERGTPQVSSIPDQLGESFTFFCRVDKLTDNTEVAKAVLLHGQYSNIILEKFEMDVCDKKNVNINRRTLNGKDDFKVVFRNVEGKCFERSIQLAGAERIRAFYYEDAYVQRREPKKVRCPKKWEGDIGLNEYIPWYRLIFQKRRKFAVDSRGAN